MKQLSGAIALLFIATAASAQVGHSPENSPFRDIAGGQELTLFAGHYNAGQDAVGVAPKPGPIIGLLYQIHVGGPVEFMARYGPKIHAWCRRWGLQEADAQDVTQMVLLRLSVKVREFVYDPSRSFRG